MSAVAIECRPRDTLLDPLQEVASVIVDPPRFATAPVLRPWHQCWGATRDKGAAAMPRDYLVPRSQVRCATAVTIGAPPEAVWPWLVQVGSCGQGSTP